jgi:hypothetical protein
VLKPQLSVIKATVGALKAGLSGLKATPSSSTAAKAPKAKAPKPAYLELVVNLQQIVFSLEQQPLETWMGLHGPLLQSMAAERHLTEQLLASCASAHGRISRSGGGTVGKEGAVAGRGSGRQAQRFGSAGRKQAKQWNAGGSRRWGTLGKKGGAAVLAGIASGSVTEAAGAAAAEAVAVAGPLMAGLTGHHPSTGAAATAAATSSSAVQHAVPATPSGRAAGAQPDVSGPSTSAAPPDAAAAAVTGRTSSEADHPAAVAGELSDTEVAHGEVSGEETEDTDSSDEEGPMGAIRLGDPDALAAALPASAHELAAAVVRQSSNASQTSLGVGGGPAAGAAAAAAGVRGSGADAAQVPTDAAAAAAVLSAAAAAGEAANGNTEMAQAVLQAHRELFDIYRYYAARALKSNACQHTMVLLSAPSEAEAPI